METLSPVSPSPGRGRGEIERGVSPLLDAPRGGEKGKGYLEEFGDSVQQELKGTIKKPEEPTDGS